MSEIPQNPRFFNLEELSSAATVPIFYPGDMVTFTKGYPQELVALSRCVEADLQRDRDMEAIEKNKAVFNEFKISFDDLSPEQQDKLLPPPFRRLKTDETLIGQRVMHQFKTGIELISAEFVCKRVIPIAATVPRDTYGWEIAITASIMLPGMNGHEDGSFPFIVVADGQTLRFGPYDGQKQKIDKVNTRAMRERASAARNIAAIALGGGSPGKTVPTRGTLQ